MNEFTLIGIRKKYNYKCSEDCTTQFISRVRESRLKWVYWNGNLLDF